LGLRYEATIVKISRRIEHRANQSIQKRLSSSKLLGSGAPPPPDQRDQPPSPFTPTSRKTKEQRRRAQQLVHWLAKTIADGEDKANKKRLEAMEEHQIAADIRLQPKFTITDALRDGTPISFGKNGNFKEKPSSSRFGSEDSDNDSDNDSDDDDSDNDDDSM